MSIRRLPQKAEVPASHPRDGVSVVIVHDHKLFAEALRWVLEDRGMKVVGVTASGEAAKKMAQREKPTLILLDLTLRDVSGLSVGEWILEKLPDTKVVAVTASADPRTVKKAIRTGLSGYLTLDGPMSQFTSSLEAILAGQVVIPQAAAESETSPHEQSPAGLAQQLTNREREILTLLVEGLNNGQIAGRLRISPNTVRAHAQRILTKLEVHSRLEAAALAIRHGLVEPPAPRDRSQGPRRGRRLLLHLY